MNSVRSAQSAHWATTTFREMRKKKKINLKMYYLNITYMYIPDQDPKANAHNLSDIKIITNDMQSQLNVPFSYTIPSFSPFFFFRLWFIVFDIKRKVFALCSLAGWNFSRLKKTINRIFWWWQRTNKIKSNQQKCAMKQLQELEKKNQPVRKRIRQWWWWWFWLSWHKFI